MRQLTITLPDEIYLKIELLTAKHDDLRPPEAIAMFLTELVTAQAEGRKAQI